MRRWRGRGRLYAPAARVHAWPVANAVPYAYASADSGACPDANTRAGADTGACPDASASPRTQPDSVANTESDSVANTESDSVADAPTAANLGERLASRPAL